jgi:hypothetical protein
LRLGFFADLTLRLKVVWQFAECLLFTLTGAVVYGAIQARSPAFSPAFLAVLAAGTAGRAAGDAGVAEALVACRRRQLRAHFVDLIMCVAHFAARPVVFDAETC